MPALSASKSPTDQQILADLIASGVGLHQRLAIVDFSTIPASQREAAVIKVELARRREAANG